MNFADSSDFISYADAIRSNTPYYCALIKFASLEEGAKLLFLGYVKNTKAPAYIYQLRFNLLSNFVYVYVDLTFCM